MIGQALTVFDDPTDANIRKRVEQVVFDRSLITDEAVAARKDPSLSDGEPSTPKNTIARFWISFSIEVSDGSRNRRTKGIGVCVE
jgi:hypothetical protein